MIHTWFPEELAAMKPPENLTLTEWACKYRELGKKSAITGKYNIDLVPFLRPAMDRCADPDVDEQNVCKPAQFGGTVAFVENPIGYYTHQDPSGLMVVLADQKTSEYVSTDKVKNMFKDSPDLLPLFSKKKFNKARITTPNGAAVDFAWATSVAGLASKPERVVICDEVNKPGYNAKSEEASAMHLADERTESYPQGFFKRIRLSTPTLTNGNITILGEQADLCLDWHCKCPKCGTLQPLRWGPKYCHGFKDYKYRAKDGTMKPFGQVVWEGGRKATKEQILATARYECGTCKAHWTTEEKNEAVRQGEEVARTKPTGNERKYWNHYNRLLSLLDAGNLATLVERFVDIFKLPGEKMLKALQGFVNSALAEPFRLVVKNSEDKTIRQAETDLPAQTVPEQAVALTCFVDVQKYNFWFAVRAWARDGSSWLVHYGLLTSWEDVEDLLFKRRYPIQNKDFAMGIWRAGIDTGGGQKYESMSMTEETYHWIRANGVGRGCRVWATKGSSRPLPGLVQAGRPLDKTPSGKAMPGGLQIISLDTFDLKEAYHYRIGQAIKGGTMPLYLHSQVGDDYVHQVTAEELQLDSDGGAAWVKVHDDNHLLDCECGNIALASSEWLGGGVELLPLPRKPKPKKNKPKRPKGRRPGGYQRPAWMSR